MYRVKKFYQFNRRNFLLQIYSHPQTILEILIKVSTVGGCDKEKFILLPLGAAYRVVDYTYLHKSTQ